MIQRFIDRPVLSGVISIFIVVLGVLGINLLPVTQYPDIAPPTVQISASYPGADAATVLESVIIPIEEQVNGVEGMNYISSTASNNGSATITVVFNEGYDPDVATVNVQNRVARATPILPAEVTRTGVVTQKQQTSALMFMSFYSTNPEYDDVYLQNYLNINVIPAMKRINGVGDASVFGGKDYAMRIWLDPQKMANYNLTPNDVIASINSQSRQATPGQLGQNNGESFEYVIRYGGKFNEVEEYENIILRNGDDGQLLRLQDVAEIELSAFSYSVLGETFGNPSLNIGIYQTPGSNAQEIIDEIKDYVETQKSNFPEGIEYTVLYDTNEFLTASIEHVIMTLLEAFALVFIVVFIFLQDFRSTLIPAIAVPVSIVGTFFFLNLFGFSINLLTLFALILAIGIVVDDAIVVVEAVHAKMEGSKGEKDMHKITSRAMDGISAAIISITLVMASVFIPVTFISGPTGVFFRQFGITLIVAIIISAINALTLSPMLSALLLKPHDEEHEGKKKNLLQRFYAGFNTGFAALTRKYGELVHFFIRQKWLAVLVLLGAGAGIYWANSITPSGFVPSEDRKIVFGNIELPPGSSLDRTFEVLSDLTEKAEKIPGVSGVSFNAGRSLINGSGSNFGLAFIQLEDWEEREGHPEQQIEAITGRLFGLNAEIPDARMIFFTPPSISGYGFSGGFEFQVLDKFGGEFTELSKAANEFLQKLSARPEIAYAQSSFQTNYPQYELKINMPLAASKGVAVSDIFSTMSGYIGGVYAADFIKYGKFFRVMVQASPKDRAQLSDLNNLFVRNSNGAMSPVTEFVELERVYGPPSVNRFNLFNTASVNGAPAPGFSTGDAIAAIQEEAANSLPSSYGIDYSGLTREEVQAGSQTVFIYAIVVLFVYLLLAAQYESFLIPFSVLLPLPIGIFGAYLSQYLAGLENNIYFQIAMVMLLGLLAKNAILIVEFALQERNRGYSIVDSAILGAKERLRPILMTSFAFIIGLMPLVTASGVGAVGNKSLATGAAFGMLIGTLGGIIVIPVMFVIFQYLQERVKPLKTEK